MRDEPWNVMLGAAAAVIVIAGLKLGAPILIPVVVGSLVALAILPVVTWLTDRGVPAAVAVLCSMVVLLVALAGPAGILATNAARFVAKVPEYRIALRQLTATLSVWLESHGVAGVSTFANPGIILDWMTVAATGTAYLLAKLFLVLLIASFAVLEAAEFRPKLRAAFGMTEHDLAHVDLAIRHVYHYLWLKTLISLATGLVAGLWCYALGIEFAVLWGLAAFLLNYIPSFGSLIAAVPPILLALLYGGVWNATVAAAGYLVINLVLGSVVDPRLIGNRLGMSPFALVVALVFWGWAWGSAGLVLAVPLTMALMLLLAEFDQFRWVATLIARAPQVPDAQRAPMARRDHG